MIAFGIRERLIEKGPESLSDSELIALLLRTGFSEKSAIEMAEDLLHSSGSLPALLSRSAVDLENVKGLGRAKTCTLLASWELCRRFWTLTKEPLPKIETAEQAYLACADLGLETQEVVCGIFLNATFGVLRKQILFRGSLTESSGSQREILREALRWNAAYLVIAHNHPSGDIAPSDEDISFTEELTRASKWIRIPLIDHLIIGRGKYFSFADARALQRKKNRSPYLSVG